jgi:tetratricopeptide (TPR) repeat protein
MTINGLLTKVMFDNNTNHEFYVEESFPLDWMYPHLTPYGIIMKINRQPLRELTDEIVQRDHHFWSEYSKRLIGNWITYDTTVEQIAEFAERVYVRRDYTGFTGDPKFIRDDQAQKAFSKLRSSIAGVYAWRLNDSYQKLVRSQPGPEQARLQAEYDRMSRETHFSFKQAFAFCAYSPEAVFRYINVLFSQNKYQDALVVAETCLKLDPKNVQVENLVKQLRTQLPAWKEQNASISSFQSNIAFLENSLRNDPNNFSNSFSLVANYLALGQTPLAEGVLERIISNPQADEKALVTAADAFLKLTNYAKVEQALTRLVAVQPDNPDVWFDMSAVMLYNGRHTEGLSALQKALAMGNARRTTNPATPNLLEIAKADPRFNGVRHLPEFQKFITSANASLPER